jgi:hypothetical protein
VNRAGKLKRCRSVRTIVSWPGFIGCWRKVQPSQRVYTLHAGRVVRA